MDRLIYGLLACFFLTACPGDTVKIKPTAGIKDVTPRVLQYAQLGASTITDEIDRDVADGDIEVFRLFWNQVEGVDLVKSEMREDVDQAKEELREKARRQMEELNRIRKGEDLQPKPAPGRIDLDDEEEFLPLDLTRPDEDQ